MKIPNMSYAEFSFLRELVKQKQLEIWKTQYAGRVKKGLVTGVYGKKVTKDPEEAFHRIMNRESIVWDTICDDKDCCNMLLRRFREAEESVKQNLKEPPCPKKS